MALSPNSRRIETVYDAIASLVNSLPARLKQEVADHFAHEMLASFPNFNPLRWQQATGGSTTGSCLRRETDQERKNRIDAYVKEVLARPKKTKPKHLMTSTFEAPEGARRGGGRPPLVKPRHIPRSRPTGGGFKRSKEAQR